MAAISSGWSDRMNRAILNIPRFYPMFCNVCIDWELTQTEDGELHYIGSQRFPADFISRINQGKLGE